MESSAVQLVADNDAFTTNGAAAFRSTRSACLDFFYFGGAARGLQPERLIELFEAAYQEDAQTALTTLFWVRDIRGGAGERQAFRTLLQHLERAHRLDLVYLLSCVPHYGRWDDLLVFRTREVQDAAFNLIKDGLQNPATQGLCAKWLPRKGFMAKQLREHLGLSPAKYRRLLVSLSNTVETQMCAKQWADIDFNRVPSRAAGNYTKAFQRNAGERYTQYLKGLASGESKVNAAAVFPHDVTRTLEFGSEELATAQWDALPNYLGDNFILPMVDTSGSMAGARLGKSITALDVSIALGLYLATKQTGVFENLVLTFDAVPDILHLEGTLKQKYIHIVESAWGMNTNIEAAFSGILEHATKHEVKPENMPKYLLILSDMQFDASEHQATGLDMVKAEYAAAGYELPIIVFWNLNGEDDNVPCTVDAAGTVLISGYSPSIMKSVLNVKFEDISPLKIMEETLSSERYDLVRDHL